MALVEVGHKWDISRFDPQTLTNAGRLRWRCVFFRPDWPSSTSRAAMKRRLHGLRYKKDSVCSHSNVRNILYAHTVSVR
jgi:hypothetical protein